MRVVIISENDTASLNIMEQMLMTGEWTSSESFQKRPVFRRNGWAMVTIETEHIISEGFDEDIERELGLVELIIVASRHRAASGKPTLTIHPIGNYGSADFGGTPGVLVPTAPAAMSDALRFLMEEAEGLDHGVSFEVTHHGPKLDTPTFFIEIGSTEEEWVKERPAAAIARTIHRVIDRYPEEVSVTKGPDERPIMVGVGGGHYAPRFTDVVLNGLAEFGHMVPGYHMDTLNASLLEQAMSKSGATGVYLHKKSLKGPEKRKVREMVEEIGARVFTSADLRESS